MNIDKYGLPVQSNGDAADQLQRVGMVVIGQLLTKQIIINTDLEYTLKWMLQLGPGEYRRFYETTTTNDVTGDQLIPTMAYWMLTENKKELQSMHHIFAQNTRKQGEPNVKTIPDFMLLRALPLLIRTYCLPSFIRSCVDILLIGAVLTFTLLNRGFDEVDDNNLIVTLVCCRVYKPTFVSALSAYLYRCTRAYSPEYALDRYHRTESGGNPEIANQWKILTQQYLFGTSSSS